MKNISNRFQLIAITAVYLVSAFDTHAKSASEIYQQAAKSTVVVSNIDDTGKTQSFGSGVFLPDGSVVTNCHVVKDSSQIKVRAARIEHNATLRYSDWDRDICSLNVGRISAKAVKIGNSKMLKVGAKVYAIGAPKGLELSLSDGIVSSLREVDGGHYIQTTAAISPGSSGGGLFDENGTLVGLITFYVTEGQNLNFAVPVEWVRELPKRSTRVAAFAQTELYWLNKGSELLNSRNFPGLLEHSLRWIEARPNSFLAWHFSGAAYFVLSQPSKSIDAYEHSLRINPKDENTWHGLGLVYSTIGQPQKAIEAYQQSLLINPQNARAWYDLGQLYFAEAQQAKAIEAYLRCQTIDPQFFDGWFSLGNVYLTTDQTAKAIDAYQRALSINSEHADTWYNLGASHFKVGHVKIAIEAFQQALRIDPKNKNRWFVLGAIYSREGQRDKVQEVYEQLKSLDPELAERLLTIVVQ